VRVPGRPRRWLVLCGLGLALATHVAPGPVWEAGSRAWAAATPAAQVTRLTLPFAGAWGVVQGWDSGDSHVGYAAYALDFVPAQAAGTRAPPRGAPLRRFACFGQPVLAPADGAVVRVGNRGRDWPAYQKGRDPGNFVILEHAPGEYTEFRHLQAGSVRLAPGERVRRGDVIGRCGNSGNAGTPHLHVALLSSIDPIATRPMLWDSFEIYQQPPGPGAPGHWRHGAGPLREGDIVRPTRP
jgi:murein DD-endopeptidase MepM/ murein hydrolase activator NlpD